MKKIITMLFSALLMVGLMAAPASAHDARVYNYIGSEVRVGVFDNSNGRYLYPGYRTSATTDYVLVPANTYVYHYYNKKFQRIYGPGAQFHVGGVYEHTLFAYRTP